LAEVYLAAAQVRWPVRANQSPAPKGLFMAHLELVSLQKAFGDNTVVNDFNLQVASGEFVSFLGPSGCWKTTTLRMIAGFETPTAGTILVNGENITNKPANQRNVGMVFQSYGLFPNLTALDNIGFGLKIRKRPRAQIEKKARELLDLIHLPDKGGSYPYQLSGGQQQRVALARALAIEPQVLLLDEPLSALDAKIRVELRAEIRSIQKKLGITAIYVTHDQEEALSLSDRVVVMNQGRIEQEGSPFEIYNFPSGRFVASFVGTLNMVEAYVRDTVQGILALDEQEVCTGALITKGANGEKVMLAIRPEMISLGQSQNGSNVLHGQIENLTFLGSVVRTQVRLRKSMVFFDTFNNPNLTLPKVGEHVQINFPPEACLIL
jgi:putative spermidine/putrescine transport system ATP-binding protein